MDSPSTRMGIERGPDRAAKITAGRAVVVSAMVPRLISESRPYLVDGFALHELGAWVEDEPGYLAWSVAPRRELARALTKAGTEEGTPRYARFCSRLMAAEAVGFLTIGFFLGASYHCISAAPGRGGSR